MRLEVLAARGKRTANLDVCIVERLQRFERAFEIDCIDRTSQLFRVDATAGEEVVCAKPRPVIEASGSVQAIYP